MRKKGNLYGKRADTRKDRDNRLLNGPAIREDEGLVTKDNNLHEYLKNKLSDTGVSVIKIQHNHFKLRIFLYCSRSESESINDNRDVEGLRKNLERMIGYPVTLRIVNVSLSDITAQLIAETIIQQIEDHKNVRSAIKNTINCFMCMGATSIKVVCSGHLSKNKTFGVEQYHIGTIPIFAHDVNLDYGVAESSTIYGKLCIKVWLCKKEMLINTQNSVMRILEIKQKREYYKRRKGSTRLISQGKKNNTSNQSKHKDLSESEQPKRPPRIDPPVKNFQNNNT